MEEKIYKLPELKYDYNELELPSMWQATFCTPYSGK